LSSGIVNDMIFAYNILMLIVWFFFNILDVMAFICIYSLYLELSGLTKLQDFARLKVHIPDLFTGISETVPHTF
jgi:hypothetical protein